MTRRMTEVLVMSVAMTLPTAALAQGGHLLGVEGGYLSGPSADFFGAGSLDPSTSSRADLDGGGARLGASFEYRITRFLGARVAIQLGEHEVEARFSCAPCLLRTPTFHWSADRLDWSVDGKGRSRTLMLELPLILETRTPLELFAGPTLASIELGGVSDSDLDDGLTARISSTSNPTLGLHFGGRLTSPFGDWSFGLTARWLRPKIGISLEKPRPDFGITLPLDRIERRDDHVSVTLVVARRLGR